MRLRDPDDYKRRFTIALGDATANISRVNQRWEIDGLEVQCLDGLFHLESIIDVRSRRICSMLTPTSAASLMNDYSIFYSAKTALQLSGPREFASKARSSGTMR